MSRPKGLSDESIKPPAASNNNLGPSLNYINTKIRVKNWWKLFKTRKNITFVHEKVVNIYIVYEINLWTFAIGNGFRLENSLFGAFQLTKNVDFDKYKYSGYGIGFDAGVSISLSNCTGFGKNAIIFGADMRLSVHVDNREKDIFW